MSFLEIELEWRETELAILKKEYLQCPVDSPKKMTLARSFILLCYAHYEGYVKYLWDYYIDMIERQRIKISNLESSIAKLALTERYKNMKNRWGIDEFYNLLVSGNYLDYDQYKIPELETNSNLWPNVLRDNNTKIQCQSQQLEIYKTKIGKLVDLRNNIAHGQQITLTRLDDILDLYNAALIVMYDMAYIIDGLITSNKHIKQVV